MNLTPLYVVDPDLAFREMRVRHVLTDQHGVPAGNYGLVEDYCPHPHRDCRRVMLTVIEKDHPTRSLASVSYAFDPDDALPGPFIDRMNEQSRCAEGLLILVKDAVLSDRRYLARLERHYAIVKKAAADPDHPAYEELQEVMARGDDEVLSGPSLPRRVGRNGPCPCGSGRTYKHCCLRKDR